MVKVVPLPLLDLMLEMEPILTNTSHIPNTLLFEIYPGLDGQMDFWEDTSSELTKRLFPVSVLEILVSYFKYYKILTGHH